MKRAKVSSVYEGRGRKRGNGGGESDESAKRARMSAKARSNGLRVRRALSIISNKRRMVTRSMTKAMKQKDEEKLPGVNIVEGKEEEKNDDKEVPEGEMLTLGDWPLTWSYDEEGLWFKAGYKCGWYSYWDAKNGDYGAPSSDHSNELVWDDDLWNFEDDEEIAKL